jgi:hypothetical protein
MGFGGGIRKMCSAQKVEKVVWAICTGHFFEIFMLWFPFEDPKMDFFGS